MVALSAIITSCTESSKGDCEETANVEIDAHHKHHEHHEHHEHHDKIDMNSTYTFMSISTAKPGKLDDLVRIASSPSEMMDYLETEEGQNEHGEQAEMDSIIETFTMYDLSPQSQRLIPKH